MTSQLLFLGGFLASFWCSSVSGFEKYESRGSRGEAEDSSGIKERGDGMRQAASESAVLSQLRVELPPGVLEDIDGQDVSVSTTFGQIRGKRRRDEIDAGELLCN